MSTPPAPEGNRRTYLSASLGNVADPIVTKIGHTSEGEPFAFVDLGAIRVLPHTPEEAFRVGAAFFDAGRELARVLGVMGAAEVADRIAAAVHGIRPAPTCLTCGATEDLEPVHVRAREGIAARTEYYCHDTEACHGRRHPHLATAAEDAQ